jgi:phenol hydroxylase P0 protein
MAPTGAIDQSCFIRVLGTKRDSFVEFAFAIGDPDLEVELVMPFTEFTDFCRRYDATVLPGSDEAEAALERLRWRHKVPAAPDSTTRSRAARPQSD